MIKPILITGAARSGTSLTAGVARLCGGWGGICSGGTIYNKKGMFENHDIREKCVKPLLRKLHVDPMAQYPLPDIELFKTVDAQEWREKILGILGEQGRGDKVWFYKGAKMCLMWPLWHKAFPEARWIIVRRRAKEIVNSCMRTGFMRGHQDEKGWMNWVQVHIKRFNEMLNADLDLREVWPQEMIDGEFNEIRSVVEWLGLEWQEEKVKGFISPKLWNGGRVIINDKEVSANG